MLKEKLESLLLSVQKPARYIGGEPGSIIKKREDVSVRFAFCFPDTYDIGMSHLGMKILYSLINKREDYWCERVFAPGVDFEELMRENQIPLYALESLDPLSEFDFIGFTMQYELSYTNVLNMLDLAGIPVLASERDDRLMNIIVAGGPCVCNPEPLADFFDIFILGEGEEVNLELMDLYKQMKSEGATKNEFLRKAADIEGIYVPSLYDVSYNEDGTVKAITPLDGVSPVVKKRIISDFDKVFYPEEFVVPMTEIVHDRASVEVLRGCIRGCRFCQAGFLYRPFREKTAETVCKEAKSLCENTGYEELSLASLSTSDHSEISGILTGLIPYTEKEHINLSLPSLRVDNFSKELMDEIKKVRKSGLTFAPEAGTQRLRDVINKNVTEDEVMRTCRTAFEGGYTNVKLYFMMGLPTETDEDIEGITQLAQKVVDLYYSIPERPKGRGVQVSISTATFVPKPFTPFEFEPQATREEIMHKQEVLMHSITSKKIKASWHDPSTSILEAVLARGDRKVGAAIYSAWKKGCKFDSWSEHFNFEKWEQAFEECGLKMEFYASRKREYDEVMPWEHIDYYVSKEFLIRENKKARLAQTTEHCRNKCSGCGVSKEIGVPALVKVRVVFEKKGRAKYISHLDLNRCMQRTFKRSGLPVWYTEGFNPHIYIMFALPLSLGYESSVEIMDFNLNEEVPFDEITDRLNAVMPEGLRAVRAFSPVNKHTAIKNASFRISFKTDEPESLSRKFDEFMSQEQINTVKKTKRGGEKLIDLKPDIKILDTAVFDGRFEVNAVFPAGTEKNLNPSLLTDLFEDFSGNDVKGISVERTGIFMGNMEQEFI